MLYGPQMLLNKISSLSASVPPKLSTFINDFMLFSMFLGVFDFEYIMCINCVHEYSVEWHCE
jgi:hypothetical protein